MSEWDLFLPDDSSCDQTVTRTLGTNKWTERQGKRSGIRRDRNGVRPQSPVSKIDDQAVADA